MFMLYQHVLYVTVCVLCSVYTCMYYIDITVLVCCRLVGAVSLCLQRELMSCSPHVLEFYMPVVFAMAHHMVVKCSDYEEATGKT